MIPQKESTYSALTIDTSIFLKHGLKLKKGTLSELTQLKKINIDFILSDIAKMEINKHLNEIEKKIKKSLNDISRDISDYFDIKLQTPLQQETQKNLNPRLSQFISKNKIK